MPARLWWGGVFCYTKLVNQSIFRKLAFQFPLTILAILIFNRITPIFLPILNQQSCSDFMPICFPKNFIVGFNFMIPSMLLSLPTIGILVDNLYHITWMTKIIELILTVTPYFIIGLILDLTLFKNTLRRQISHKIYIVFLIISILITFYDYYIVLT